MIRWGRAESQSAQSIGIIGCRIREQTIFHEHVSEVCGPAAPALRRDEHGKTFSAWFCAESDNLQPAQFYVAPGDVDGANHALRAGFPFRVGITVKRQQN